MFGDGTQSCNSSSPDWVGYNRWREKCGASGSLYDFPAQLFEAGEKRELAEGIEWTIYTGSDAVVVTIPSRAIIHFLNDDLISVHSTRRLSAREGWSRLD